MEQLSLNFKCPKKSDTSLKGVAVAVQVMKEIDRPLSLAEWYGYWIMYNSEQTVDN